MNKIDQIKKAKDIIYKYRIYIICCLLIILSIISIVIQKNDRKEQLSINEKSIDKQAGKIGVYITGQIKSPGVYYLSQNSRVDAAIDIAGGLTQEADISKINLSKKLVDSDKIVIPEKQKNAETTETESSEEEKSQDNSTDKVNINTANEEELMTLSGIGSSTASKIVEYRKSNKFETIDDIMNVKGIGQSKFNSIKDNICVN